MREVLLWGGIALKILLLAKLGWLTLVKRYWVLVVYLSFSLFSSVFFLYLNKTGVRLFGLSGYSLFWIIKQPLTWVLYFLLMLELYSLMLEGFPGIQRLGRLVVFLGLAVATAACSLVMMLDEPEGFFRHPFLAHFAQQERSIFLCLTGLTLIILVFIFHYRIPVSRNQLVLYGCFGGYFIGSATLLVLYRYFGDIFLFPRNLLNGLFFFFALLSAFGLLSRAGEVRAQPINALWGRRNQELEDALLLELRSFNQVLAKVLKT